MSQLIQVSVDDFGRIFIPAPIRERLNLSPGMILIVEKGEGGGVQLRIESRPSVLTEKDGLLVARVTALGSLANAIRNERDRRVFDLLQRVGL